MSQHDDRMQWPFFGEEHRRLATEAERWATASLDGGAHPSERADVDRRCRELVGRLGKAGLLRHCLRAGHREPLPLRWRWGRPNLCWQCRKTRQSA